jgi:hypothetical protein
MMGKLFEFDELWVHRRLFAATSLEVCVSPASSYVDNCKQHRRRNTAAALVD